MHHCLTLAGAAVAVLAGPVTAAAAQPPPPTIFPLAAKCYVSATPEQRQLVTVHGENFAGLVAMDVDVDGVTQPISPPPMTDALGRIDGSVQAPYVESGQRLFTIRLSEQARKESAAVVTSKVTALSVTQSPLQAKSSSKVRFRLRGFTDKTKPIYAHYVYKGVSRRTVLMGKPYGDCGLLSVRRKQFPFRHPHIGKWEIQFDQEPAYNPQPGLYTRLPVRVKRTPPRDHR
jgi:hypothetical protein